MDRIVDFTICLAVLHFMIVLAVCKSKKNRKRIHPYLQERKTKGRFAKDLPDLITSDVRFKENFHMELDIFFCLVEPHLQPKRNTRPTDAISPKEKLAVVLEYLACGTLQRHVSSVYRISKQHFGVILDEVCNAICSALAKEMVALTTEEMNRISETFELRWNLPNCVGAVDGKHVSIKCPANSGSLFYNYKGFFSIVLMAVADGDYRFVYVDIGAYGSEGDANVFATSALGKALYQNTLQFPPAVAVGKEPLPFYFVGDDAFPLHPHIMKPFVPKRSSNLKEDEIVFNYRLSRARRCVENAFGILCAKFYCLARKMLCSPDRARNIITACCHLHNFLLRVNRERYCPATYADSYDSTGQLVPGEWRKNVSENSLFSSRLRKLHGGRLEDRAKSIRNKLKAYVNSETGSIPWQQKAAYLASP